MRAVVECFCKVKAWELVVLVVILLSSVIGSSIASVACDNDATCVEMLWVGSECIDGFCSNPFGSECLRSLLGAKYAKRVCNSDDPPGAAEAGICSAPDDILNHMEIRILSQNWESAFFGAWLQQIVLSELLGVPVTIETGTPDANISFYGPQNVFQYGKSNLWEALRNGNGNANKSSNENKNRNGDCRDLETYDVDGKYLPCAHVLPEVWSVQGSGYRVLERDGVIEPPEFIGLVARNSWYVPKFVTERDPSIMHYLGLQGKRAQRKLAKMFKRPTTWKQYCDLVSKDGCATEDEVAKRAPQDESENGRMFVEGLYIGHFRATEKNNCTNNPNCTGHVSDYPCAWSGYLIPQAYHNNIPMESDGSFPATNGYSYSQLMEMRLAANATRENLMQYWWTPDISYSEYHGTDMEFQRISLPNPSQDCIDSRVTPEDRCSFDKQLQRGDPAGACDDEVDSLKMLIVSNLYKGIYDKPVAWRSPAYDFLKRYSISELQIGKMFDYWYQREIDKWNYDPRDAVCRWAAENINLLKTFIPRTYPRFLRRSNRLSRPATYFAIAFGTISIFVVLVAIILTYKYRQERSIRTAQVGFLFLLLVGLLMIPIGSLIMVLEPTKLSCIFYNWLLTLGYTLELTPLIVKAAAMQKLMNAARRFKRVQLHRKQLYGTVLFVSFLVLIYMLLWTFVDPPLPGIDLELTEETTESGETVVTVVSFCRSSTQAWSFISLAWKAVLLLSATVLAVQNRKLRKEINESQVLAAIIYAQFLFVLMRVVTYLLQDTWSKETLTITRSVIGSLDALFAVLIYFVPKFLKTGKWASNRITMEGSVCDSVYTPARISASALGNNDASDSNHI